MWVFGRFHDQGSLVHLHGFALMTLQALACRFRRDRLALRQRREKKLPEGRRALFLGVTSVIGLIVEHLCEVCGEERLLHRPLRLQRCQRIGQRRVLLVIPLLR